MSHLLLETLGISQNGEIDLLKRQMHDQQVQLSQLRTDKALGNLFYGGPIKTQISTSGFTSGPFIRDLDATFPIEFNLRVADYFLRILRLEIRIIPRPIRSSVAVGVSAEATPSGGGSTSGQSSSTTTPSGGGTTSGSSSVATTPSGGGSTTVSGGGSTTVSGGGGTSAGGSSHSHSIDGETVNASSHSHPASAVLITGGQTDTANAFDGHSHFVTGGLTGGVSSGGSHSHDIDGVTSASESTHTHTTPNHQHSTPNHTHDTPNHSHNIDHTHSVPNHFHDIAHTHSTPNHTHPAHDHDLTLAISEGGESTDIEFWLDGVNRTAELGGPWNDEVTIDITRYVLDSRGLPIAGDHPAKFESATVGAIELWLDWYVIAKPTGN